MAISKRKTKSSKNIKANVSPSKSIYLPFKEIGETRFEEFTRKLCNLVFPKYERFELKCSKGQKQFGVDAECFNADGDTETLLSAKCYDRTPVTAAKIKTWVDDFFGEFEIHWKEKGVKRFILAITHDGNNDLINDEVRNQKKVLKRHGIEFQAWFNSKLHDICIKDERLVYEFFGATVLPDYYPHYKTVVIDSRAPSAGLFGTDFTTRPPDELDALKKSNNKSVSDLIEIYVSRRRAGNSSELKTYLTEVKTNQTEWQTLTNEVQAKIHRLSASMALDIGNTELAKAETAYAEQLAKLPDQVLPALIAYHETGVDAALEVLNEATEPSEFELKVALLIEGDRLDDAIVV
nr:hypothetical protein [Rhizobiaceae bacterium]